MKMGDFIPQKEFKDKIWNWKFLEYKRCVFKL